MLNLKNTLIGLIIAVLLVLAADYLIPVSPWIYIGIILVFLIILAWGSKSISLNFYLKSHIHGNRNQKSIALTFDDGPDGQVTPMILDLLKENNVKAAFFIIGNRAAINPEILKRIDREGHVIGGHSYSHHLLFDLFSSATMRNELQKSDDLIFSVTGKRLKLFRPPYGVTNPTIARVVKIMHYESIGWSLKSYDTVNENASAIFSYIISKLENGDIILLHDSKPWTLNVLSLLIPYLKSNNIEIERVDKLLNIKPYVH